MVLSHEVLCTSLKSLQIRLSVDVQCERMAKRDEEIILLFHKLAILCCVYTRVFITNKSETNRNQNKGLFDFDGWGTTTNNHMEKRSTTKYVVCGEYLICSTSCNGIDNKTLQILGRFTWFRMLIYFFIDFNQNTINNNIKSYLYCVSHLLLLFRSIFPSVP